MDRNLCACRSIYCKSLVLMLLLTLVGLLGGCGTSATTNASPTPGTTLTVTRELKGTISEFPLPTPDTRPGDIVTGPDSNLWYTSVSTKTQKGMIGRITPGGNVCEYPLPANSFSTSITAGPDGNLWFKEPGKVGRITPTGEISEFPLSTSSFVDNSNWPLPLGDLWLWGDITTGPDHSIWFTEPGTNTQNGKIGRITPSGTITEFPMPTPKTQPFGITNGPDGNLWFTAVDYNSFKGQVGRITPTGKVSIFPLPSGFYSPYIAAGPDGNLWFTESDLDGWNDKIGRITPTGAISEYPVPNRLSNLNGFILGPDNALWFTEDEDNHGNNARIGRITLTGKISEFPLPAPGSGPVSITVGPDGALWFTEANSNKIGRLV